MVANRQPRTFTVEQYVDLERSAETKNELIDGVIYAMTGGSPRHALLCLRVGALLHAALRGKRCTAYSSDLHLFIPAVGRGTYADVTVFCEPLVHHGARTDIVVNPTVVVEVLSPGTEIDDRTEKMAAYRTLSSLKEYVLVSQDRARVEVFTRQADGAWLEHEAAGLDAVARLESIGVQVSLRELYDGVDFS